MNNLISVYGLKEANESGELPLTAKLLNNQSYRSVDIYSY